MLQLNIVAGEVKGRQGQIMKRQLPLGFILSAQDMWDAHSEYRRLTSSSDLEVAPRPRTSYWDLLALQALL